MNFNKTEFEKIKNSARFEYEKIGSVFCPALKTKVVFNSDGFHHLRYDGSRNERNKKVQYHKFSFFFDSVDILKKTTTLQEYRRSICAIGKSDKNGLRKTKIIEWFGFFSVISFSKGIRIKVIIRRIGGESGQYHFWSVIPFWNLSKMNNKRIIGSKNMEDN